MKKIFFMPLLALCFTVLPLKYVTADTGWGSRLTPPNHNKEKLGLYIVDSGENSGLDSEFCEDDTSNPIIRFKVPATMNASVLNDDGTLKQESIQALIDKKVIGSKATIHLSISFDWFVVAEQKDIIWFNNKALDLHQVRFETFNGQSDLSFDIDIGRIKFNSSDSPAFNEITLAYKEIAPYIHFSLHIFNPIFCSSVDWVSIEFDAASPYVLTHGINATKATWDEESAPGVLKALDESGVLYDRFSTSNPNGSASHNARDLKEQIIPFLDRVKSKSVNIIAHSKGGIDAQYLATISKEGEKGFEVLSLSTLSTPHLGTVTADLQTIQLQYADEKVNIGEDPNGYVKEFLGRDLQNIFLHSGIKQPRLPGLNDLTTDSAHEAIGKRLRNTVVNTFTIGADAGPKCERQPADHEIDILVGVDPTLPITYSSLFTYIYDGLRLSYQLICDFTSVADLGTKTDLIPILNLDGSPTYGRDGLPRYQKITTLTYASLPSFQRQLNDVVVSQNSANPSGAGYPGWGTPVDNNLGINHSTVKSGDNIKKFLDRTIQLRPESN